MAALRTGWRKHERALLGLLIAVLILLFIADLARVWRITNHNDLGVYLRGARRLVAGESIYQDEAAFKAAVEGGTFSLKDNSVVWPLASVPGLAIAFVPLLGLPLEMARGVWWGINVGAYLAGGALVLASLGRITPGRVALVLALMVAYEPAVTTLRLGQVELVQFLLLAITLYALYRGWDGAAGVALALAAGLKVMPGALAALYLWRRRWRAALWTALAGAAVLAGSFAVVGFDKIAIYLSFASMYGIGGAYAAFPFNQSLNGFFTRNLVRNIFGPTLKGLNLPGLARALILGGDALLLLGSAALTWHAQPWPRVPTEAERLRFSQEYALGVAAMLLVFPHSQVYALVWLMIPLIALGVDLLTPPRGAWWEWVLGAIAYGLVGRYFTLYLPGVTRLAQSHYFLGMVLLAALWGWRLWVRRKRAEAL